MPGEITSGWLAVVDLTAPEAALLEATLAHRWWVPEPGVADEITEAPKDADWGPERTVRAQVLYQLLTGQGPQGVTGAEGTLAAGAARTRSPDRWTA